MALDMANSEIAWYSADMRLIVDGYAERVRLMQQILLNPLAIVNNV